MVAPLEAQSTADLGLQFAGFHVGEAWKIRSGGETGVLQRPRISISVSE